MSLLLILLFRSPKRVLLPDTAHANRKGLEFGSEAKGSLVFDSMGFPGGSMVKTLLANSGASGLIPRSGRSRGLEDPLEKEIATHSSILARKSPWTDESSRLQSMGLQRSRTLLND